MGDRLPVCLSCNVRVLWPLAIGQTVVRIKMPLGTEVGLSTGDIVLDGAQLPPRKGHKIPTLFGLCLLWPNGRQSQQLLSSCCYFSRSSMNCWMIISAHCYGTISGRPLYVESRPHVGCCTLPVHKSHTERHREFNLMTLTLTLIWIHPASVMH